MVHFYKFQSVSSEKNPLKSLIKYCLWSICINSSFTSFEFHLLWSSKKIHSAICSCLSNHIRTAKLNCVFDDDNAALISTSITCLLSHKWKNRSCLEGIFYIMEFENLPFWSRELDRIFLYELKTFSCSVKYWLKYITLHVTH